MSDTTNCLVCGKNIDIQVALYNTGKPNCCDNCAVERRDEYKRQAIKQAIEAINGIEASAAQRVKAMRDIQANHLDWLEYLIEQLEQAQERIKNLQSTVDAKFLSINKGDEEQRWLMQEENIRLTKENKQLNQLKAVNQKLTECLEWYALTKQYDTSWDAGPCTPVLTDKGQRARDILAKLKQ